VDNEQVASDGSDAAARCLPASVDDGVTAQRVQHGRERTVAPPRQRQVRARAIR